MTIKRMVIENAAERYRELVFLPVYGGGSLETTEYGLSIIKRCLSAYERELKLGNPNIWFMSYGGSRSNAPDETHIRPRGCYVMLTEAALAFLALRIYENDVNRFTHWLDDGETGNVSAPQSISGRKLNRIYGLVLGGMDEESNPVEDTIRYMERNSIYQFEEIASYILAFHAKYSAQRANSYDNADEDSSTDEKKDED